MPEAYAQLREITTNLEKHYKDMQDFEFTIAGRQAVHAADPQRQAHGSGGGAHRGRHGGRRPDHARRKPCCAWLRQQLDQLLHPVFDPKSLQEPGEARDGICRLRLARRWDASRSTAEDAVEMAAKGPVILVRKETTPDDIHGMDVAKGILTAIGGKIQPRGGGGARHGPALRRGRGRASASTRRRRCPPSRSDGKKITVKEGDFISLDGTTGDVYPGPGEDAGAGSELAYLRASS